jgi:biotin transport system permease protein
MKVPAWFKFVVLFCAGIGLYLITSWPILAGALAVAVIALLSTREPARRLLRPVAGLVIIIGVVVTMTGLTTTWHAGVLSGLRSIGRLPFSRANVG